MTDLNIHSLPEFNGERIPVDQLDLIPLMPARTSENLRDAINEDKDTFDAVGTFRRPHDRFDVEANPQFVSRPCEFVVVTFREPNLIVLPMV